VRDKIGGIFRIFEDALKKSFEEAVSIYYRKILGLLRECPSHYVFFEFIGKIFSLFHELIFNLPKQEDYKKLIVMIYGRL